MSSGAADARRHGDGRAADDVGARAKTRDASRAARPLRVFRQLHFAHAGPAISGWKRTSSITIFNSSEKRLARTLLLLARYGNGGSPLRRVLPRLSQETLAEMVGTTRSRVNFFMNKFRKLGLIEYNGGLTINGSLLSLVLHD